MVVVILIMLFLAMLIIRPGGRVSLLVTGCSPCILEIPALSRAVLPKPPFEPVSAKLAYLASRFYFFTWILNILPRLFPLDIGYFLLCWIQQGGTGYWLLVSGFKFHSDY